ncbi:MAG: hypothetical protein COA84_12405 [Robiginitomaculum sp.]|nr:MAG: hypothetical protein COA84_12405 [Robiginitomaculum sp.]
MTIKHPHSFFILLINLFFGLSVFGWFVALFWAVSPGTVVIPRPLEKYF